MIFPKSKRMGKYLKERRMALGLSQHQVSRLLSYPNSQSISNWERGCAFPPLKKFKKLIKTYDISQDELMSILLNELEILLKRYF